MEFIIHCYLNGFIDVPESIGRLISNARQFSNMRGIFRAGIKKEFSNRKGVLS